jgi:hypothetical protein
MLYVILAIAGITFIIWLIAISCEYDVYTDKNKPKIKFEAFKKFYAINPDRWNLDIGYVKCKIVNENKSAYRGLFYTYDSEQFYFSFLDYFKYKRFCKQLEKDKLNKKHMEATAKMIGMVKKDIANMENLAEQQKQQAIENFDYILKNLK